MQQSSPTNAQIPTSASSGSGTSITVATGASSGPASVDVEAQDNDRNQTTTVDDDTPPGDDQTCATDTEPPTKSDRATVSSVPERTSSRIQIKIMNAAAAAPPPALTASTAVASAQIDTAEEGKKEEEEDTTVSAPPQQQQRQAEKQRPSRQQPDGTEIGIGATHVDEQAPQLNRRFYLGLNRVSVRLGNARARRAARARRRRQEQPTDGVIAEENNDDDGDEEQRETHTEAYGDGEARTGMPQNGRGSASAVGRRSMSTLFAHVSATGETLVQATLVEEVEQGEVVMAEPLSYFARKWKIAVFVIVFLVGALAVSLSLFIAQNQKAEEKEKFVPSEYPSSSPSAPPSFDPSPTLEIVQKRGYVRCGLRNETMESGMGPHVELCRAVAAVLFGDPDKNEGVSVRTDNRFQQLHNRDVDVLLGRATHTIEREVRERTTGSGFAFSTPYFYDGMTYFGEDKFVECAEDEVRYGPCAPLRICVKDSTTHHDFLETAFPSDFLQIGSSLVEMQEMLMNSTDDSMNPLNKSCNVIASDRSNWLNVWTVLNNTASGRDVSHFVEGEKTVRVEPLAIVTRNDDREFSDIINWVVQALFYGVEQGVTKNTTLCQNYTHLTTYNASDLNFMNAVYCVGNHYEIWGGEGNRQGMNQINDGESGMIYATPFGKLDNEDDEYKDIYVTAGTTLHDINENRLLNCGVVVPDGVVRVTKLSREFVGMTDDYCRTLAAALLDGNYDRVNITIFSQNDNSSFVALNDGTIDVLAGGKVEKKHDFGSPPSIGGVHFSTPYFYGNETASDDVSFFSLATREDDVVFSSFVNCVVLATIYAQEYDITRRKSKQMPFVSIFGSDFKWALRDAIAYSGNYDEIYRRNFGVLSEAERGRNYLNEDGGPQIHSFPGLITGN